MTPADPSDADAETLRAMVENGAVLTNERNIRHYLYGANEGAMSSAKGALESAGYSVESTPSATDDGWLLLAERVEVVNAASVESARPLFERLAANTAGREYDGW